MKTTASNIIRLAGLAAMGSGLLFGGIQAIHPLDLLTNVTTTQWAITHFMGVAMTILGLLGITGIYARQVEEAGWLGLVGFLLMAFFYAISTAFQFIEAFVSPVLATLAPEYVEGFLGLASSHPTGMNLGALPVMYSLSGFLGYILGGLVFGIATFRAGVLPRWAGLLLAMATLLPLASALVPHPLDRIFAVPTSLALIWLGYALWAERRQQMAQPLPNKVNSQLRQAVAK